MIKSNNFHSCWTQFIPIKRFLNKPWIMLSAVPLKSEFRTHTAFYEVNVTFDLMINVADDFWSPIWTDERGQDGSQ